MSKKKKRSRKSISFIVVGVWVTGARKTRARVAAFVEGEAAGEEGNG